MLLIAHYEIIFSGFGFFQVPAIWKLAGETSQQNVCPPWVSVHPEMGRIWPHSTQRISISVSAKQAKIFSDREASEVIGQVRNVAGHRYASSPTLQTNLCI